MNRTSAIEQAMGRCGTNQSKLSLATGISRPTLSKKIENPDKFTLLEIEQLNNVLRFTDQEMAILIRG